MILCNAIDVVFDVFENKADFVKEDFHTFPDSFAYNANYKILWKPLSASFELSGFLFHFE